MYTYEEIPTITLEDLEHIKKKLTNSQITEQQKKQVELLEQVLEMQYADHDR